MALNLQCGTITAPGSTGNQTTTLPADFDPKALILWGAGASAEGKTPTHAKMSMGMATYRGAAAQQGCCTYFSQDSLNTSIVARGFLTTQVYQMFSAGVSPTVSNSAAFVSFGSGASSDFVLNWTVVSGDGWKIKYLVLGGSDITDAMVHSFALSTAAATQDVTVTTGFGQPNLIMWMASGNTAVQNDASSFAGMFGAAKSATERYCAAFNDEDAAGTMLCAAWEKERAILALNPDTQAADAEADLSATASWPTDGYQLSYADQAAIASQTLGLALKGTFTSKVTFVNSPVSVSPPVNTDIDHGSVPKGALTFHATGPVAGATTIDTSSQWLGTFTLGGLDGTNEVLAGAGNDDADGTSDTVVASSATKAALAGFEPTGNGLINAEADGVITGNTVRLSWTTTHDVDSWPVGVVTFGSSAVTTSLPPVPARRPQLIANL